MNCDDAAADLARMHDGLLDEDRARAVREHVGVCAACREVDASIAFSRRLLSHLSPASLRDEDRLRIRGALLDASVMLSQAKHPPRQGILRFAQDDTVARWLAVAAAVALVVAGAAWYARPRVKFVAPPAHPRSLERIAATTAIEEPTSSVLRAKQFLASRAGVSANIQPVANSNRRVIGVRSAPAGAAVVFAIDDQPVTLAVARAERLADPPPESFFAKRLEVRHTGNLRVFTWTASGDAYSLAVPKAVKDADACAICHAGAVQ